MAKYIALIRLEEYVQNAQELASFWGDLHTKLEEDFDTEVEHSYAVLGDVDFVMIFDAPDRDAAVQAALAIGSYGLETQTMELIPIEDFADLATDS